MCTLLHGKEITIYFLFCEIANQCIRSKQLKLKYFSSTIYMYYYMARKTKTVLDLLHMYSKASNTQHNTSKIQLHRMYSTRKERMQNDSTTSL